MVKAPRPAMEQTDQIWRMLRPRSRMDLIVSLDLVRDMIDVRSTTIYESEENRIVLAQAEPPILKSMVGLDIEATFTITNFHTGEIQRYGYYTTITDYLVDYRLSGDAAVVPAIVIGVPRAGFHEASLRLFYRVQIIPDLGISFKLPSVSGQVNLHDLSVGGVLAFMPGPPLVTQNQEIGFQLLFPDEVIIEGKAEVRRVSYQENVRGTLIGLKFFNLDVTDLRFLQRTVNKLMAQERGNFFGGGRRDED